MTIRFGSVCSGIEAASVAWNPLGWQAAWFSEIEPFPSAVLSHHFPDVPNLGDMATLPQRILSGEVEAPDVLCGGTPCQAFSVAGKQESLDDPRGQLSLIFCEIADAIDTVRTRLGKPPVIVFWENVPGVLRTKDNAFGCFLGGLVGADSPCEVPSNRFACSGYVDGAKRKLAWRTLDAQFFGVPQRRRRVFVVASARENFDPTKVLFEPPCGARDSRPSQETGEGIAAFAGSSFAQYRDARQGGMATLKASGGDLGGGSENLVTAYRISAEASNCMQSKNPHSGINEASIAPTLDTTEPSAAKAQGGLAVVQNKSYDMTHPCDVIRVTEGATPTLKHRMGTGGNQVPLVLDERERERGLQP